MTKEEADEIRQNNLIEKDDLNAVILERIKILIKENNLTQVDFFEKINYPIQRSNASALLNGKNNSKISVVLLDKISSYFNVSINWLIGNLPKNVKKDEYLDIQKYTGLTEKNIELLHNLKIGDLNEKKLLIDKSEYPKYKAYIEIINNILNSNFFTTVINDLRVIDLNLKNSDLKGIGYSISNDGQYVQLSHNIATNFLVQNACKDFEKLIEDIQDKEK